MTFRLPRIANLLITMSDEPALKREQSLHPREFPGLIYAYPVLSRRSGGLSIGVNLNIDKHCNFDCPYCQVDRTVPRPRQAIVTADIRAELDGLLASVDDGGVCRLDRFAAIADADKRLKDIAVSGDGEPTMESEFPAVCTMLAELQAARPGLDFKLVLITNSTLVDRAPVLKGIGRLLSRNGEVWAKLDAGTEAWYQRVNVSRFSLDRIEANLIRLGRSHPFSIQSLFCALDGEAPGEDEISAYLARLRRIRDAVDSRDAANLGGIREVQLYTLARKPAQSSCTPVTSEFLVGLRGRIEALGLAARVYGVQA